MLGSKLWRRCFDRSLSWPLSARAGRRSRPRRQSSLSVQPLEWRQMLSVSPLSGDPDDQISEATPVDFGQRIAGALIDPTDVNMVAFTVADSQLVEFDIRVATSAPNGHVLDAAIRLFDSAGNELASNDNHNQTHEPFIQYTFTSAGTYYLGVAASGNDGYDAVTGEGDAGGITDGIYELTILPVESAGPAGPEFLVNTVTDGDQVLPAIASDADGDFVVVWVGWTPSDPNRGADVFAQVYDAAGVPQGGQFLVNTITDASNRTPKVAMDADGDFVVVWQGYSDSNREIFAKRYTRLDINGDGSPDLTTPAGDEFRVNTYTPDMQEYPQVAMGPDGAFVVTWMSFEQDGSDQGIFAQRFDSSGAPLGDEFQVNSATAGLQHSPTVGMDATGGFVISWTDNGDSADVYAQRYDSAGAPLGEFQVNTFTTATQHSSSVSMAPDGSFVIAWNSEQQDGSGYGIYAQYYDGTGAPTGGEVQVNTYTGGGQFGPNVSLNSSGDSVMTWYGTGAGDHAGIFAQRLAADGSKVGTEFRVNTQLAKIQQYSSVAIDNDGDFVIAWTSRDQDGSGYGIYAQRFGQAGGGGGNVPPTVDAGGPYTVQQGFSIALSASAVDPDSDELMYLWDLDGDDAYGETETDALNGDEVGQSVTFNAGALSVGPHTVTFFVDDGDGGIGFDTATINIMPQPSPVDAGGPYTVVQESSVLLTGSVDDPDPDGLSYLWDLDGDNAYGEVGTDALNGDEVGLSVTFNAGNLVAGSHTVTFFVDDGAGGLGSDTAIVNVLPQQTTGDEFRVNQLTEDGQWRPAVAMDADGDFVVVWESYLRDAIGSWIMARQYNAAGEPQGDEFIVSTTVDKAGRPSVAIDADGDFVIAWDNLGRDADFYGVFARRYSAAGLPLGPEFQVNTSAQSAQQNAKVAMDVDGDFAIAWVSYADGGGSVFAQRYNAAGEPQGGEFTVDAITDHFQFSVAIAMDAVGNSVISWLDADPMGQNGGLYAQRFASDGGALGSSFSLTSLHVGSAPSIDMDAAGNFVMTWDSQLADGSGAGIVAARFNALGERQGDEFLVNTFTESYQTNPAVALDATGDFVISWLSNRQDGHRMGIFAQRYSAAGTPQGDEFQVNVTTADDQALPAVAMNADGDFVVAWQSFFQDGDGYGIYARQFQAAGGGENVPPVVDAGGPYEVQQESTVVLTASASDPDSEDLIYLWDLDGDNAYGEVDSDALNGDEVGLSVTFNAGALIVGPHTVSFFVDDGAGGLGSDTAIVNVLPQQTTGPEFRVNQLTDDGQWRAAVAMDADGDFVVVWESYLRDAIGSWIVARQYNAAGEPQGDEFIVSTTIDKAARPSVAIDADGDFVVAWDNVGRDGDYYGVFARRYSAAGLPLGGEFRVNTTTRHNQTAPKVAMDFDGDFVIAWTSTSRIGPYSDELPGAFAQRYNAAGEPLGAEFPVGDIPDHVQAVAAIAMDSAGNFVIGWQDADFVGQNGGLYLQRFASDGTELGSPFQVTSSLGSPPSIDMDAAGNFVVAWDSHFVDGGGAGIVAARFNAFGERQGHEFLVNTFTASDQGNPDVAMDVTGDFVITWRSSNQDGHREGVFAQRYSAAGAPQGDEFQVNITTADDQAQPAVAMSADGDFVIAWQSFLQDGDGYGIYARQFQAVGGGDNAAPVVDPGGPYEVQRGSTVVLTALASDPDSEDLIYLWDLDGDNAYGETGTDALNGDEVGLSVTFRGGTLAVGKHTVTFFVDDGEGGLSSDTAIVNVVPEEAPSIVDAGGPYTVEQGTSVVLTGSVDDPDPDGLSYLWDLDGDNAYGEVGTDALNGDEVGLSVTFDAGTLPVGPHTVTFFVDDGAGGLGFDTAIVNVVAQQSAVDAGGPYTVEQGSTVVLTGSVDDPAPDGLSYLWDLDGDNAYGEVGSDALNGNEVGLSVTFDADVLPVGQHTVTFFVDDGAGGLGFDTAVVQVVSQNAPPTADAGGPYQVRQGVDVVLTGTAADPDGDTLATLWDLDGDGQFGETGEQAARGDELGLSVIYSAGSETGPFTVSFAVHDGVGGFALDTAIVNVIPPLEADAGGPYQVEQDASVVLTGSVANPGTEPLIYLWDLDGDGLLGETGIDAPNGDEVGLSVTYIAGSETGPFTVFFYADDGLGAFAVDTAIVNVIAGPAPGPEIHVNTTARSVDNPAVAIDRDGGFIVAWVGLGPADSSNIYARRFNADGSPVDDEFVVAAGWSSPDVAIDADGNFVIVWASDQQDDNGSEVYAQVYGADGNVQIGSFRVNTFTAGSQDAPSVATDADGAFVVVWMSEDQDGSFSGIYGQRFDANGALSGPEFQVNTITESLQAEPSVAMNDAGSFVVTWFSGINESQVYARRFDSAGVPLEDEFQVSPFGFIREKPTVAMDPLGEFVITWHAAEYMHDDFDIFAQRYNAAGEPQEGAFLVNSHTDGNQFEPQVVMDVEGNFAIVWHGSGADDDAGIFGQRYTRDGLRRGDEFRVNLTTGFEQSAPAAAMGRDGDFVVAWHSKDTTVVDGHDEIFARLFDSSGESENVPPTADAGGPYEVQTGSVVVLTATAVDPDSDTLIYLWDLDGDGAFGETGVDAAKGDEVGLSVTFNSGATAIGAVTVSLLVDDSEGGSANDTAIINVVPVEPIGPEIRVDTSALEVRDPAVAINFNGDFIVAWLANSSSGEAGVYARQFDSEGAPLGAEFLVSGAGIGVAPPAVAIDGQGNFIIAWTRGFGDDLDVYAQAYNADGTIRVGDFRVNPDPLGRQDQPAIAIDDLGRFVVAWVNQNGDGSSSIYAQRMTLDAAILNSAFEVNSSTTLELQEDPSVAVSQSGSFVIAWAGRDATYPLGAIRAQRYGADGLPQDVELQVSPIGTFQRPSVAINAAGEFVIAWEAFSTIGNRYDIVAQRFDAVGAPQGGRFDVNSTLVGDQSDAQVVMDADGNFVIVWSGPGDGGDGDGVFGQRFTSTGARQGDEFRVNVSTDFKQSQPTAAMSPGGTFVVAWHSEDTQVSDGHNRILARLFGPEEMEENIPPTADAGGPYFVLVDDGLQLSAIVVDPDSSSLTYLWDLDGDGNFGETGPNALYGDEVGQTVTFNSVEAPVEALTVAFLVDDGDGGTATDTAIVNVLPRPVTLPDPIVVDDESLVNTITERDQGWSKVAMAPDGAFVIVWGSNIGSGRQARGQGYNADGQPQGGEFQIGSIIGPTVEPPHIAMDADGDFVVVWPSHGVNDQEVFARRFTRIDADGDGLRDVWTPAGDEFQVNTFVEDRQSAPDVAMDPEGNFVVAWMSEGQDGWGMGVYAQRYDFNGDPQGGEFLVNTITFGGQGYPHVAMDAEGDFVIAWVDGHGIGVPDVYARRFDHDGVPQSDEFLVNTFADDSQGSPAIAMAPNGSFVIAWSSWLQEGESSGVFAQRYDAQGTPLGEEFQVNTSTFFRQDTPSVAIDADGDFVVVWNGWGEGDDYGIFGQRFNSAGNPIDGEFLVNVYTQSDQRLPSVAMDADGDFVVTWTSREQDGSMGGIYARRYEHPVDDGIEDPPSDEDIVILDDMSPGYTHTGGFATYDVPTARDGDVSLVYHLLGPSEASWSFNVAPGRYRVAATWFDTMGMDLYAGNAPFSISDGDTEVASVQINQRIAPNDFNDAGSDWELLGDAVDILGGTLTVRLRNAGANGYVLADAIRIERIGPLSGGGPGLLPSGNAENASTGASPVVIPSGSALRSEEEFDAQSLDDSLATAYWNPELEEIVAILAEEASANEFETLDDVAVGHALTCDGDEAAGFDFDDPL